MALIDRSIPLSQRTWKFWVSLGIVAGLSYGLALDVLADESTSGAGLSGVVFGVLWTFLFRFVMLRGERRRED